MHAAIPMDSYKDRDILYQIVGAKYNKQWGARVIGWFMEENMKNRESPWISRYQIYSNAFKREIPLSSLYLILGKLTTDGLLEMKIQDRAHYFRLGKDAHTAMAGISALI